MSFVVSIKENTSPKRINKTLRDNIKKKQVFFSLLGFLRSAVQSYESVSGRRENNINVKHSNAKRRTLKRYAYVFGQLIFLFGGFLNRIAFLGF